MEKILKAAEEYLPLDFSGEAVLTVGRAILFAQQGVKMVINCAPFGCMPGTITTGIFGELQARLGIPILNQFYDGRRGPEQKIGSYLTNIPLCEGYDLPERKREEDIILAQKENKIFLTPLQV
jgi:Uncharacterized protein conserved in bacteria